MVFPYNMIALLRQYLFLLHQRLVQELLDHTQKGLATVQCHRIFYLKQDTLFERIVPVVVSWGCSVCMNVFMYVYP